MRHKRVNKVHELYKHYFPESDLQSVFKYLFNGDGELGVIIEEGPSKKETFQPIKDKTIENVKMKAFKLKLSHIPE